jgi:hypothetical protein
VSAAVVEAPSALFAAARAGGMPRGRRSTLEELLESRWQAARAEGEAECPVCSATLQLEGSQARCRGCGATLS